MLNQFLGCAPSYLKMCCDKSNSKQNWRYFLHAGQEPPKREFFKFPTGAARISNLSQTRADLGSELRQVQRQHWACTKGKPKSSSLPTQRGGMGQEDKSLQKGSRCPEEKRQRTWDFSCSKTNWLENWNIMGCADSAPLSVHLSPGHFICPSSSQQNKMKWNAYFTVIFFTVQAARGLRTSLGGMS